MEDRKTVQVNTLERVIESDNIEYTQSASSLFKYMKELKHLDDTIKRKAILPRYCEESIEYLEIEGHEKIVFPMVCFCDINLSRVTQHVRNYGYYGIGLRKEWGIKKGIQPIHYINRYSPLREEFSKLFTDSLNNIDEEDSQLGKYQDYLLSYLLYIKPVTGEMRIDGEYYERNFTDEKEWRFVPEVDNHHEIDLIIPNEYIKNDKAYKTYSDAINQLHDLWLTFDLEEIEYIIVKTIEDREKLIRSISVLEIEEIQRYRLVSKIIVYDIINKDW